MQSQCMQLPRTGGRLHASGQAMQQSAMPKGRPIKRARLAHTCMASMQNGSKQDAPNHNTLLNLDSLLGEESGASTSRPSAAEATLLYWWQIQPRQAAPPRQHAMAPGQNGRFINEDVFKTEVRTGRATAHGTALDVPRVQPYMCYLLLMTQLTVYAFGTTLGVLKGPEVSQELFMYLGLDPSAVLEQGELWRLLTCLSLHSGMAHLTLNSFALAFIGMEAEAVLGHSVFLYTYFASGIGGAMAALLLDGGDFSVGASGAIFGLLGALMGVRLMNKDPLPKRSNGQIWLMLAVAAANVALTLLPDGETVSNAGHLGGFLVGLAAACSMGPSFQVTTELDIPEGSMIVPADAKEMSVVVDTRGRLQRVAAGAGITAALAAVLAAGTTLLHSQ